MSQHGSLMRPAHRDGASFPTKWSRDGIRGQCWVEAIGLIQNIPVKIVIASAEQDCVESINKIFRNAGIASRCIWAESMNAVSHALQEDPELLIVNTDDFAVRAADLINIRSRAGDRLPAIRLQDELTSTVLAEAFNDGFNDAVSLTDPSRLVGVCERELRLAKTQQSLDATMDSATQFKQELKVLMDDATDALAYVQEGIIVDVNPAWLKMLGFANDEDVVSMPVMDFFKPESRGPLKGAMVACLKGKWTEDELETVAVSRDQEDVTLKLTLVATHYDGETCVKLMATAESDGPNTRELKLHNDALTKDPSTLLYHRTHFVDIVRSRLSKPVSSGLRVMAWIKPDSFSRVCADVGLVESESVFAELADIAREQLLPNDICGRFDGLSIVVLLERGRLQDAENWAQRLVDTVSKHVFTVRKQSTPLTCTVGLCRASDEVTGFDQLLLGAHTALRRGKDAGGNSTITNETSNSDSRIQNYDAIWLRHLKSALVENRFRLLRQPIVGLDGEDKKMFDLLVRMIDQQGKPVLPSEFIPAAERNNMMQAIDRWVIAAALEFCRQKSPQTVFIKLSYQSINDATMGNWIAQQLKASNMNPKQLCFEISEDNAKRYLSESKEIRRQIQRLGARFALEHLGNTRDSDQLIEHLQPDFVKIDGTLVAGLAADEEIQAQVRRIVALASNINAPSIAERVEDANTMAVLWQMGIHYMQGHYVHEPEVILQDVAPATTTLQLQA